MRRLLHRSPLCLACLSRPAPHAQYPDRPIHLIVPQAAGSATDTLARILGASARRGDRPADYRRRSPGRRAHGRPRSHREVAAGRLHALHGPDRRAGDHAAFGGATALRYRARLPADLLVTRGHLLLAVSPTTPFQSVEELIAYAKQNPGKLLNASSSNGSPGHVGGELFKFMTGTDIVHVPYKGGAPAINDLIAGRVQLMFESLNSIVAIRAFRPGAGAGGDRRPSLAGVSRSADRRARRACRAIRRRPGAASSLRPACRGRSSISSTPR